MKGLMMAQPLLDNDDHAACRNGVPFLGNCFCDTGSWYSSLSAIVIVSGEFRQLANAMQRLGIKEGDRIATLAWTDFRHLEIYYGISCCRGYLSYRESEAV